MRPRGPALTAALVFSAASVGVIAASDDGAAAREVVGRLEADPSARAVTADALRRARDALQRATSLREAGDPTRARLLDGVAREWAETGDALARAAAAELAADEAEGAVLERERREARARALLEDTAARRGRAEALVQRLENPPAPSGAPAGPPPPAPRPPGATR